MKKIAKAAAIVVGLILLFMFLALWWDESTSNQRTSVILFFLFVVSLAFLSKIAFYAFKAFMKWNADRKTIETLSTRLAHNEKTLQDAELRLKDSLRDADLKLQVAERTGADSKKLAVKSKELLEERQKVETFAERYLSDTQKSSIERLTAQNFATTKKRIETAVAFCAKLGVNVAEERAGAMQADLKEAYEAILRKEYARQEQQRIKEQIRAEQRLEAERQRELQRLENQQLAIETALQRALAKHKDEYAAEVESLRQQLEEARSKTERAKSQAELTKAGYIYVISNIGSFGDDVYKIGMTRRLEPLDRIRELGDASVPFPFDVHMMISCDDAPTLENALHRQFNRSRINRVNLRKEFFKCTIQEIQEAVESSFGTVEYIAEPEALEYRNSLATSVEDFAYVGSLAQEGADVE